MSGNLATGPRGRAGTKSSAGDVPTADPSPVDPQRTEDALRRRCPVAHDEVGWMLLRHADVLHALHHPEVFSNRVSRHLMVPNGMDGPEHARSRALIDPYFAPTRLAEFAPRCRRLSAALVAALPCEGPVEIMATLAEPFAVAVQCAFMGWPESMRAPLLAWIRRKRASASAGPGAGGADIASEFDHVIRALLGERRRAGGGGDDVTARLLVERIDGQPLSDEVLVSILRNWTVGELGSLAASVGIIAHYLAERPALQSYLRAAPHRVREANDEILRIRGPLCSARRRTTCPVALHGAALPAEARVALSWTSANRDEAVFGDPDAFRLDRDPAANLLYGAGTHVCPGADLARLELEAIVRALLVRFSTWRAVAARPPLPAEPPVGGWRRVWVTLIDALG